ncbi:hypothetical protein KORDIASMS9_03106 [Kordia sp. SMS9]|nr:hypothetical protein KORDIASMS9_03106 [Kordia sp. SMS9]
MFWLVIKYTYLFVKNLLCLLYVSATDDLLYILYQYNPFQISKSNSFFWITLVITNSFLVIFMRSFP